MAGMSVVTAFGNIGRDAELRSTPGGDSVCNFSICANVRKGRNEIPVWYDCTIWGKRGEALVEHLTKGTSVVVTGQLVPREYKGKKDELRTSLDVDVRELAFAGGGGGGSDASASSRGPAPSGPETDDENSIPF